MVVEAPDFESNDVRALETSESAPVSEGPAIRVHEPVGVDGLAALEPDIGTKVLASGMTTGTIYTANEALARAMERWPGLIPVQSHTVKLLQYRHFAQWFAGYDDPTATELVWVVGITAAEAAPVADFGMDGSSEAVAGWWYQFSVCNGEPKTFGGLDPAQFTALEGLIEASEGDITPCPGSTWYEWARTPTPPS